MAVRKNVVVEDKSYFAPIGVTPGKSFWDKAGPVMAVLLIVASFALGAMWTKISYMDKGLVSATGNTNQQGAAAAPQQPAQVTVTLDQIKDLFSKDVVKFGKVNSRNLFVMFSDPSCPFCHIASGTNPELNVQAGEQFKLVKDGGSYLAPVVEMKKLVDNGQAGFVWLYTPGHGAGELATKALYCAYDEGKFWEVHDFLMTNSGYDFINNQAKNDLSKADLMINFVKPVFSSNKFSDCLKSDRYKTRLANETSIAGTFGVGGTPGFFVNETRFAGAYNWNDMKSAVK